MGVSFFQARVNRYCRDGTNIFEITGGTDQTQLLESLRAENKALDRHIGVRDDDEVVSNVVFVEADKDG